MKNDEDRIILLYKVNKIVIITILEYNFVSNAESSFKKFSNNRTSPAITKGTC